MPLFDPKINYLAKVKTESENIAKAQSLFESTSVEYLDTLSRIVMTQSILSNQIKLNKDKLLQRKREEKLCQKEIIQMAKIHDFDVSSQSKGSPMGALRSVVEVDR